MRWLGWRPRLCAPAPSNDPPASTSDGPDGECARPRSQTILRPSGTSRILDSARKHLATMHDGDRAGVIIYLMSQGT